MPFHTRLDNRSVLAVGGEDRISFLQGLLTNDIRKASSDRALYALLLSPQGRFLHDLFVVDAGDALLLDVEADRRDDLLQRLAKYRLRAKVSLTPRDELAVLAGTGPDVRARLGLTAERGAVAPFAGGFAFVDPRRADLGVRILAAQREAEQALAAAGFEGSHFVSYDRLRLELGVPDGSRDLAIDKALPVECGLDALGAISFEKGCYVGQEVTARSRYRAVMRNRLLPVDVDGPLPEPGTPVLLGEANAGHLLSGQDGLALAFLRLDAIERSRAEAMPLMSGVARVLPRFLDSGVS